MTDREMAESAVRGLALEFGLQLPTDQIVHYAVFLAEKLRGKGWAEAIQAGTDAAAAVRSEADAERSRRERMKDGAP